MEATENCLCNICNTAAYEKKRYKIRSGFLVQCSRCGLFYANPRRTAGIEKIVSGNTATERYPAKCLNYWGRILEFNEYLERVEKIKQPPGKLLDIGCYEGFFLDEARKRGWECVGVEPNVGAARFASNQLKLNIMQCILKQASFEARAFDVITLFAALEHMPDPMDILKEIKRIVKPDGLIAVSVPVVPFYLPVIRSRWRMFIGDHYYFFTGKCMRRMLSDAGFRIVDSRYVSKSVDLNTVTSRLIDPWQPNNAGRWGRLLRKLVCAAGLERFRWRINLYDVRLFLAVPATDVKAPSCDERSCNWL